MNKTTKTTKKELSIVDLKTVFAGMADTQDSGKEPKKTPICSGSPLSSRIIWV